MELVSDLSAEYFMNCFKRFVARKGIPRVICSDNGTTFDGASHILEELLPRNRYQFEYTSYQQKKAMNN